MLRLKAEVAAPELLPVVTVSAQVGCTNLHFVQGRVASRSRKQDPEELAGLCTAAAVPAAQPLGTQVFNFWSREAMLCIGSVLGAVGHARSVHAFCICMLAVLTGLTLAVNARSTIVGEEVSLWTFESGAQLMLKMC